MAEKLYLIISGCIFLLVGVFHFFRLAYHWPILVGAHSVPFALSYIGGPVSIGYSVWAVWLLLAKSR
jgi:hypothetical protein